MGLCFLQGSRYVQVAQVILGAAKQKAPIPLTIILRHLEILQEDINSREKLPDMYLLCSVSV